MRKRYRGPTSKKKASRRLSLHLETISLAAYDSDEVAHIFWDKPQETDFSIIFSQMEFYRKSIVLNLCPTICTLLCIINKN